MNDSTLMTKTISAEGRTSDPPSDPRGSSAASQRLKHSVRYLLPAVKMRVDTKIRNQVPPMSISISSSLHQNKMSDVSLSDVGSCL